ncbi:MAG: hypothetical protein UX09_C0007G0003 [Candidatus Uhrbacteria bacterium GW2011_GWE2_45_35]|uniref:Uncharacterized protein n=1 Tax=Candidatus Uhrbacteria bacterium GW2011_GWE2_45_35 TaxID=1618993 RepID=A0A0G1MLI1_9BACT|nr:MAG: hypothetical protein UX09_C0007G0003 [Candidatus Uhrbacteria bacterium GW2011_GWE2_45_35]HCU31255.1 hypothetical protein [Candidatus Uhrbacteria bacterium]
MAYEGNRRDYYSGRNLEADTIGVQPWDENKPYQKKLEILVNNYQKPEMQKKGFVPYDQAVSLIREFYPGDPTNPEKDLTNDLMIELREEFGIDEDDGLGDRMKFYSAIKTPLDFFHGVDGWFEFENPGGRKVIISVDVTSNIKLTLEDEKNKADIIIVHTEDRALVGTLREIPDHDFNRTVRVLYAPIADPTHKYYAKEGGTIDFLTEHLAKAFKEKGIIIKKAA